MGTAIACLATALLVGLLVAVITNQIFWTEVALQSCRVILEK